MIFRGLVFLQPLFWFSLSLVILGAVIGAYPGFRLQAYLSKVKKKNRVAQQVLSASVRQAGSELQSLGDLENLGKRSVQIGIDKGLNSHIVNITSGLKKIIHFIYSKSSIWQTLVFFRIFLFVTVMFLALIAFQQQRVFSRNIELMLSGSLNPQHGGAQLLSWFRELIALPEIYTYLSILFFLGFIWALFSSLVRFFSLTGYWLVLILLVHSFGGFLLGDPLEISYLTPTPTRSLVVLPVDQISPSQPSPTSFGRIFFEGFQLPYWGIVLGLPPLLVRSYRIDFGESVAVPESMSQNNQADSSRSTTRQFILDQAAFPRPLAGSLSPLGLDALEIVSSLSLALPFARRSGFLTEFDQPEALVVFDQGLFTLVFQPSNR